jgi:cell fate regulator YaaT (PSP1 superfamily)
MTEYLVSFGRSGDFGRFHSALGDDCGRGERVVVRTASGLELGTVLCPVAPIHAKFLSHTSTGELLRRATAEDDEAAERLRDRADALFQRGRALVQDLGLPLEIMDVDVLLDGQQATIYHLRREACDYRPMVSELSRLFEIRIVMENLAVPMEEHGCGRPDCGHGEGGCSSCGSGGGCSTCGAGTHQEDIGAYLASLKADSPRVPLL